MDQAFTTKRQINGRKCFWIWRWERGVMDMYIQAVGENGICCVQMCWDVGYLGNWFCMFCHRVNLILCLHTLSKCHSGVHHLWTYKLSFCQLLLCQSNTCQLQSLVSQDNSTGWLHACSCSVFFPLFSLLDSKQGVASWFKVWLLVLVVVCCCAQHMLMTYQIMLFVVE